MLALISCTSEVKRLRMSPFFDSEKYLNGKSKILL